MKKILSLFACFLLTLSSYTLTIYAKESGHEEFDTSVVMVMIKKEYSGKGRIYYPSEFSDEFVEEVQFVACTEENNSLFPIPGLDVLALVLKEPSEENVLRLIEILKDNPLVEDVKRNGNSDIVYPALTVAGDADCNGKITAADARIILRISVGLEDEAGRQNQFDTDYDGKVTAADARYILRVSVNLEEPKYYITDAV